MGPLNRISPADTWQARRCPWGALHYGEVRAESAADAYAEARPQSFTRGREAGFEAQELRSRPERHTALPTLKR